MRVVCHGCHHHHLLFFWDFLRNLTFLKGYPTVRTVYVGARRRCDAAPYLKYCRAREEKRPSDVGTGWITITYVDLVPSLRI
jgi:hypothetical protein